MTHRLCRTLLVNAGTNQRVPSARIAAVDPRGGAAVLGDNGVGKTSALQIVPLFFGHPPSQIVSSGQGNLPMIRFLLPTDASAIAFEYQRGPNETDLRLAVIRRRADDYDTPFYRFYTCGFIKDLFVRDGRFLSDDETQLRATELDIPTSSKLSTAEYRSAILRVPSNTKERDRLRRFSLEWSYGPKPLDNLDRLVAAMVKKHVKFSDIVQVAVGLAQQDIGHGSERSRLVFRQGRAPIVVPFASCLLSRSWGRSPTRSDFGAGQRYLQRWLQSEERDCPGRSGRSPTRPPT
ncbi:ATP-binding protein [Variovorax paradoxus]|uniref:ATP-binding protein n=1 Tax=Variovorax paradoxus TaxID=34073 RepID=UPI003D65EC6B